MTPQCASVLPPGSGPAVTLIVLTYNSSRWIRRCIASALQSTYPRLTVVVADNQSSDDTCGIVESEFPDVVLVRNPGNLGFAEGNNRPIASAMRNGADYVMLLNADTWIESECIAEMVAVMESEPTFGFFSALILDYDSDRLDKNWMQFMRLSYECLRDLWQGDRKRFYETESGSGAALMMRTSTLRRIGFMDPLFFMYFEEIDLIRRARFHGIRSAFSTTAKVHHYNHLESSGPSHSSRIRFERGHMLFTLKNQDSSALKCWLSFALESLSRVTGALMSGQWSRTWALVKAATELHCKAPFVLWRRRLEMHRPAALPELTALRLGDKS